MLTPGLCGEVRCESHLKLKPPAAKARLAGGNSGYKPPGLMVGLESLGVWAPCELQLEEV